MPPPDGGYPGQNTAEGQQALFSLTTGIHNTALGAQALFLDHAGNYNTATGSQALFHNISGDYNVAAGAGALFSNTTGFGNTANGVDALRSNMTGASNTGTGVNALFGNTAGSDNTATGVAALYRNTTGNNNTAIGEGALVHNTTGNFNIALGVFSAFQLTTGSNNIDIGNEGVAAESNTIRIGGDLGIGLGSQTATYIAGIFGVSVPNGLGVVVDSTGHLGTVASSQRFKDEIKPMDKASEAILALKPVTFRYKQEFDPKGIPQFGLVAEEVEKVNPDLVARDAKGEVYTVRYEAVNAMLLNEFLKEHRSVQELKSTAAKQEATIGELRSTIAQQQKRIEGLTAVVQKVSDQLELNKPAPQIVENNQ